MDTDNPDTAHADSWPARWNSLVRRAAFRLRNHATLSPPFWFKTRCGSRRNFLRRLNPAQRDRFLILEQEGDFSLWYRHFNTREMLENLYVFDICRQIQLEGTTTEPGLDIGSRNGGYLPALYAASPRRWDGVEIDAYRRYWNLSTRHAYARRVLAEFPNCRFIPNDVRNIDAQYSVITWFLPFLFSNTIRRWGLPTEFFEPLALLQHASHLLSREGTMLIVNQGVEEAQRQSELLRHTPLQGVSLGPIKSCFSPYRQQRFGWLVRHAKNNPANHTGLATGVCTGR